MDHSEVQRVLAQLDISRKQREERRRKYQGMLSVLKAGFKHIPQHRSQHSQQIAYQQIRHQHSRQHQIVVENYHQNPYQTNITQISQQHLKQILPGAPQIQNSPQREEQQLLIQNKALKQQLIRIQSFEKERLLVFSNTLKDIRHKYTSEVEKLTATANSNRQIMEDKVYNLQTQLKQLKQQIPRAQSKCASIQTVNTKLREQVQEGNTLMGKYVTEIKQQYIFKIQKIEKIYEDSQEKIEAFEKKFNQDEFVENTLKNEQILKGIEENAKKAEQTTQILEDFSTLLNGKREILQEINQNNGLKQKEIEKMTGIEKRMKDIMDRLNREKDVVVEENRRMAGQLMEVKKLLMGGLQ